MTASPHAALHASPIRAQRPGVARTRTSRPAVLALVVAMGIAVAVSVVVYLWTGNVGWVLCSLAAAAPIVMMAPIIIARRDYDMFEPMSFVLLSVLIGVTARTFLIVMDDSDSTRAFLLLGRPLEALLPGLGLIIVGVACLSLGYLTKVPHLPLSKLRGLRSEISTYRLALILVPLVAVSVLCVIAFMRATGGWQSVLAGAISNKRSVAIAGSKHSAALGYYRWGAKLSAYLYCCTLSALVPRRLLRSPGWLTVAVGLAILAVLLPFLASSRSGTLLVIVITAVIVHYGRGRLSLRDVSIAAAVALLAFAGMGVLRAEARHNMHQSSEGFVGTLEETIGTRHWLGVDKTSLIIEAVPRVLSYQWGRTMIAWVAAPVPRTMWPDKPLIRSGPIIGAQIYGLNSLTTGVPPGIIGELYWNFGFLGIPLGMFAFGAILRSLYRSFEPLLRGKRTGAIVLYTVTVAPLALQLPGSDVSGSIIGFLTAAIPTMLILSFIAARRRTGRLG